jgi:hypothetical protein
LEVAVRLVLVGRILYLALLLLQAAVLGVAMIFVRSRVVLGVEEQEVVTALLLLIPVLE